MGRRGDFRLSKETRELINLPVVIGWENSRQVAEEVWSGLHSWILRGDLIFAYRSEDKSSYLKQLVIVKMNDKYVVSQYTDKYTMLMPGVGLDYLTEVVLRDFEDMDPLYSKLKVVIDNL